MTFSELALVHLFDMFIEMMVITHHQPLHEATHQALK
jgi:hypothetical protein